MYHLCQRLPIANCVKSYENRKNKTMALLTGKEKEFNALYGLLTLTNSYDQWLEKEKRFLDNYKHALGMAKRFWLW
jgi:hypothetical protein